MAHFAICWSCRQVQQTAPVQLKLFPAHRLTPTFSLTPGSITSPNALGIRQTLKTLNFSLPHTFVRDLFKCLPSNFSKVSIYRNRRTQLFNPRLLFLSQRNLFQSFGAIAHNFYFCSMGLGLETDILCGCSECTCKKICVFLETEMYYCASLGNC